MKDSSKILKFSSHIYHWRAWPFSRPENASAVATRATLNQKRYPTFFESFPKFSAVFSYIFPKYFWQGGRKNAYRCTEKVCGKKS